MPINLMSIMIYCEVSSWKANIPPPNTIAHGRFVIKDHVPPTVNFMFYVLLGEFESSFHVLARDSPFFGSYTSCKSLSLIKFSDITCWNVFIRRLILIEGLSHFSDVMVGSCRIARIRWRSSRSFSLLGTPRCFLSSIFPVSSYFLKLYETLFWEHPTFGQFFVVWPSIRSAKICNFWEIINRGLVSIKDFSGFLNFYFFVWTKNKYHYCTWLLCQFIKRAECLH